MHKIKTIILATLLLMSMTIALIPIASASTGQILIETETAPSPSINVPAGGDINLYLGDVTWSGGQVYLILGNASQGFSDTDGMRYTPTFSLSDITGAAVITVSGPDEYPGTWTVGQDWINGSIPTGIAGGEYFVKAFDGALTFLAVTDRTFTVTGSLSIYPSSGAAGTSLTVVGNAFPANGYVNVSYINPLTLDVVTIQNLVQTDDIGAFSLPFTAPDILGPTVNMAGDNVPAASNVITFNARSLNETGMPVYTATYTEGQRGLLQIGVPKSTGVTGNVLNATGVFGNLTSFSSTLGISPGVGALDVGVHDNLVMAGNWFYPGSLSINWDNKVQIATATANGTGFFNITSGMQVPVTSLGAHNITIVDANGVKFVIFLNVVPSITITPTSGPVGTTVSLTGYGFPAATASHAENVTIYWDGTLGGTSGTAVAWANPNSDGYFELTFTVPSATGGSHNVVATSNETFTSAMKTFTVTSTFYVTPSSFANNGSLVVTATGTGFDPSVGYTPNMDNQYMGIDSNGWGYSSNIYPDSSGNITIQFIGAGFSPGIHVISLYPEGSTIPSTYASFTVLAEGDPVLTALNDTLTANFDSLDATLVEISGDIATVDTKVGQVKTSVSSLSASISSISNGIATIQTSLGTVTAKLNEIDPVIGLIAGDTAELKTSVGTITTSLESLNTKISSIEGDVATVQTDVGTIKGTITSVDNGVATIETDVGTLQTSIGSLQTDVDALQGDVTSAKDNSANASMMAIVAMVFAIIAAIAAIFCIFLIRQKIAS